MCCNFREFGKILEYVGWGVEVTDKVKAIIQRLITIGNRFLIRY